MKYSFQLLITAFTIFLIAGNSVYCQENTPKNSHESYLKVRYPDKNSSPQNSSNNGGSQRQTDSPAGSISVNEDPFYNAMTPVQLVQQAFITGCLTASNVKFGYYRNINSIWTWMDHAWDTPANRQMGYFQKATSDFPIDEGIILTTGIASSAMGPNNSGSKSDLMVLGASDPDLSSISGEDMNDAAVLEFDFVPAGNTMEFKYMFSSEEYLEYVETSFNDAFGFFLSGPGITGPYQNNAVNLAVLPNGDPVTINTIHPAGTNIADVNYSALNEEYYLDNPQPSLTYQFDGGTVILTATYAVIPCQTYHIKLSVADAFDQEFDGAVFLAAKSFNSENLLLTNFGNSNPGQNNIFEGCNDYFRIERTNPDISKKLKLDLLLSGTTTNGSDIKTTSNQPFPTEVTIPANSSYIDIPYSAIADGVTDNNETFIIEIATSCPCAANVVYVTKTIHLFEQVILNSISKTDILCNNQNNGTITANTSGGSGNYEYSINNGTNWQSSNLFAGLPAGTYTILVKDNGSCYNAVSGTATILNPPAIIANAGSPVTICSGQNTQLNGSGGDLYSWSPATGLSATNIANPIASPTITTNYTLTATNLIGQCPSTATVTLTVIPSPTAVISPMNPVICKGNSISLTASGGNTYSWNPGGATTTSITVSPVSNTSYTVTATSSNGCSDQEIVNVIVKDVPSIFNVNGGGSFCAGSSGVLVGLSGSQNGVSYQLKLNGTNSGAAIAGTGSALSFGNQNQAGTYTIEATTTSTGCIITMSGNAVITINPVPNAPTLGAITQPTCAVATGSIVLVGLPSGSWTINPGSITGNTSSTTLSGILPGNYTYTVTNSVGCASVASANIVIYAQPITPSIPLIGIITQPSCAVATGSVVLNGLPVGSWTINPGAIAGTGTSKMISGLAAGIHNYTVTNSVGCTSLATSNVVINTQPVTPSAPIVGIITQPTCAVVTGSVALSGLPTGNWTINPGAVIGTGTNTTLSGLAAGTYSFTVTNSDGCSSSASTNVVFVAATPTAPVVGTITQPTCAVATGSVMLSGLPSGNWTINPGAISGTGSSIIISGISAGTYNYTVTNSGGCTSVTAISVVINTQPVTPSPPTMGTITQPSCTVATGSVVLNGLPTGNWTLNPGAISGNTTTTTLSGLTAGTYSYSVTSASGCTSTPSTNIVINTQPTIPSAPIVGTITQPTCSIATGSVTLTGLPAGSWTINPGAITGSNASTTISGLVAGTYTFTVSQGCTSAASANIVINPQPATPVAPIIGTITQPSCTIATGSVILNGLPAGSWTINPGSIAGTGTSKTISGLTAGTYSYTVTSSLGCTSSFSANVIIITQPVTPSSPIVGTITHPTCSVSTGSAELSGLPAGNWTINPGAITGTGPSTTITGIVSGTRTYTVTNSVGCTSAASANVVINAQPITPGAPVVGVITQPTCSVATGSVTLSGLPAGNWTINPGAVSGTGSSKIISNLVSGSYIYTVTNAAGCTSGTSASVVINTHPGTPSAPVVVTITQPTCEIATGSVELSGLPTGNWTINPGAISGTGTSKTIAGLLPGTYTYTVTNSAGCTSLASANVVIIANAGAPGAPEIVSITQPSCSVATGSVILDGLPTGTWTIYPGGITGTGPITTVSGLLPGIYNFTVTNGAGCNSASSINVVINAQPVTPATPIVGTITQPTCTVSTGSAYLSGLPAGNWTINPGSVAGTGTSKTITSLPAGTYNFTVTNSVGCTSLPTANVDIIAVTPFVPTVGTITQPTCSNSTGSVVLNNLPSGNWIINPGAIAGTGLTYTRTGLVTGSYTFTVTNALGCTSLPTGSIVINAPPVTPSAPIPGVISQPNCTVATGSVILNNLPAGNWTINPGSITGTGTSKTLTNLTAGTYNYTVTNAAGCTSLASANIVINAQPITPSAPTIGLITQPTCSVATGSVVLNDLPSGNWTINPGAISGTGVSKTISGLIAGTYSYTVTNSAGCTSIASASVEIISNPGTPAAPTIGAISQPSCNVATGNVILNGLPAGNWTINPGAITGTGTSTTISNLASGTYTYTVQNESGCISLSSGSVVINSQPVTPAAPVVGTITQPTCTVATGSVILSGLPAGSWTLNPGSITGTGTSKTIPGITAGIYTYTVTNSVGCTSVASANVIINSQPVTPSAPLIGVITQTTCATATGSVVLNGLPAGSWTINPGAITGTGASATITNIPAGSRTYSVTNAAGCTSVVSANVVINTQPLTPSAPIIGTITQPTCALATGSIVLNGLPTGNWTINPGAISGTGSSKTISGLFAGTYNYTVTNAVGCTSMASANAVINVQPVTPTIPIVGTITQPTCTVATGIVELSGLPTGSWTINPGAIAGSGTDKTISGLATGSYNFIVINSAGCSSAATAAVVINPQPVTPPAPTLGTITQPSCSVATGSLVLTGLPSGNWTINPGSIVGNTTSTIFSGLAAGTYNYTVTNSVGCTSAASTNAVISTQPITPSAPVVGTITQPICSVATGSVLLSGLPTGTWTINPGAITGTGSSKTLSGLSAGTYNFTVTNVSGCTSLASTDIVINTQPVTPAAPIPGTITQPTCSIATGSVILSGLPSGNWTVNPGSITGNSASTTISFLLAGTYNFTVTNSVGCTSLASTNVIINPQPVTPSAPTINNIVQPTCSVGTGSVTLGGLPVGNWTINPGAIAGTGTSKTITGLVAGTYAYTVTNVAGCTSIISASIIINHQPATPEPPAISTVTQPNCSVATGSIQLSGLPPGIWSLNPGSISGSTTDMILSGLVAGTYSFTVTNTDGCISLPTANVVINTQPETPAIMTVGNITQPTCEVATGSVILNNLPSGNWVINPGAIAGTGTSTTISGLSSGTYIYTVTNFAGCTSTASANVVINGQPAIPSTPIIASITQPTCFIATGSVTLSGLPNRNYVINPGSITGNTTSLTISGLTTGTYNYTVTKVGGCTSLPSANVVIDPQPPTPPAPTLGTISQPLCAGTTGGITVTVPTGPGMTYSLDGSDYTNTTGIFLSLMPGIYTVKAKNSYGCISPGTSGTINPQPADLTFTTPIITNVSCSGGNDGKILISANGGTGSIIYSISPSDGSQSPTGTFNNLTAQIYTITANDQNGCTKTINVTVENIPDVTKPVISGCPSNITKTNDPELCSAVVTWIEPTATDNCTPSASLVWTRSHTPGSTFPVGTTNVTYTAKDAANIISAVCSFTITVTDSQIPIITGCPTNISKTNDPGLCSAVVTWIEPTATDNCTPSASLVWTKSHTPGSTFPVGTTTVTYTAKDATNNVSAVCSFTVTVTDNQIPVITDCPSNITKTNDTGLCSAVVNWIEPTASDNCTISANLVWTKSHTPGSTFPVGTTTVTYTAKDAANNVSAVCSFTVTVTDNINPTVICPATRSIEGCSTNAISAPAFSSSSTSSTYAIFSGATNNGSASDNCGTIVISYVDIANGSCPITVTRTWTITDATGNNTSCTQEITITDNVKPILSCPASLEVNTNLLNTYVGPIGTATASDNCTPVVSVSNNAPSAFPLGSTSVVWKATDACGNTSTCTQVITVSSLQIIANDDIGSTVNGYSGGISYINVLTNDLLNTLPVNPSDVTLSFVSSTNTGVTLSGINVVVAAGTPAGTYTLTYEICELLNPANCDQAVVTVLVSSASIIANDDNGSAVNGYASGTSFTNVLGNDLLNGLAVNPSEIVLSFVSSTNPGVTLVGTDVLVAAGTPAGTYTLTYQICELLNPANCDQAVVTVTVISASIVANDDAGTSVNGYAGGTSFTNVLGNDLLNGLAVNPAEIILSFVSSTNPGVSLVGANVIVAAGTPAGTYTLTYQICELLNPANCDQAIVTVTVASASIVANDDAGTSVNGYAGGTSFTNVLGNDLLNGLAVNPAEIVLSFVSSTNSGVSLVGANVIVAVGTPAGTYTLTYQICELLNPTNCDQAVVTVLVSSASIIANDDNGSSVNGYAGGTSFSNVLGNDLLNGLAVNPSEIVLSFVSSTNPGVSLSGTNVVVAAGIPAGTYTLTYEICELLNPANCDQAIVTVTVTSASIVANDDAGTSVNGYAGGTSFTNVLGNDLLNGLAVIPAEVVLSFVSSTNPGVSLVGANVVVAAGTPAGIYTLTYQICELLNPANCDQAVVTVTVTSASIVANDDAGTSVNGYAGGTSFTNVLGNDLLNGLAVNPAEIILSFVSSTNPGVTLSGTNVVVAAGTPAGTYTLTYQICELLNPANCDQAVVTVTVTSASIVANDDAGTSVNGYAGGTSFTNVLGNDLLNSLAVNPAKIVLSFVSSTNPGVSLVGANVIVAAGTPAGTYTLTYQICELLNPVNCDQAVVTVTVSSASIVANDDAGTSVNGYAGGISFTNVLGNDLLNGLAVNPAEIILSFVSSTNPGVSLVGANVLVAASTPAGTYTLTYQICELLNPTNCDQAIVTVTVTSASIVANDDAGTSINGYTGGTSFTNVLGNDLLNGLAIIPAEVVLSFVSSTNPGVSLSGTNVVVAAGTPAGTYTLTYQICELLNPTNCDQAVVTVTVSSASIIANDDNGSAVNGYAGGTSFTNVLGNDLLNGLAVNPSEIVLSFVSSTNPGVTLVGADVVVAAGTSAGTYTLTYQICELLNPTNCDQAVVTVIVTDNEVPTVLCPSNATINCITEIPLPFSTLAEFIGAGGSVSDNNGINELSFQLLSQSSDNNTCPETITRVYSISDLSDNVGYCSHFIIIDDTIAPVVNTPANISVECSAIPTVGVPTATDNCDDDVTVTYEGETRNDGVCADSYTLTRTWKATDNCLNETTASQTITVQDVTAPILTIPANVTVECSAIPTVGMASATDNCDDDVTVTYEGETRNDGVCADSYTLTRTWKATGNCLNETTASQTITVQDVTAPILTIPANVTVECSAVPAVGMASATDNCDADVTITYEGETRTDGVCADSYTLTRTWKAVDNCLNETTANQTITVQDVTKPILTIPASVTVECSAVPTVGMASATDNCDADVTIIYEGETRTDGVCADSYTLTRTWKAVDNCLNETTASQTITVQDVTKPILTIPASVTVECSAVPTVGMASATDNCDADVTITYEGETRTDGACADSYTLTRTWKAVDNCLNETIASQTITVQDTTAPEVKCPEDIIVQTDSGLNTATVAVEQPVVSDNCGGVSFTNNFNNTSDASGTYQLGLTLVTWTATDACGNTTLCQMTVTVKDNEVPVLNCPPSINVQCIDQISPAYGSFSEFIAAGGSATDNNGINALSFQLASQASDNLSCPETITRIYSIADTDGNTSTCSQLIIVKDSIAPIFTVIPQDIVVVCDGTNNLIQLTSWLLSGSANDNCGVPSITNNYSALSDLCGATGSSEVTFTVTDECGNTASTTATFTIADSIAPSIDLQASNLTIECDGAGNIADLNLWLTSNGGSIATDICSGSVSWTNNFTSLSDLCGATGSSEVTFTASDECGNTASTTATFTIADSIAPSIDLQASNLTVDCNGAGNIADLNLWLTSNGGSIATDICSGSVSWTNNFTSLSDLCGATGSSEVTFTASDECGNTASTTATFTIADSIAPSIDLQASNLTVESDGAGNIADLNAWLMLNGGSIATDICSGSVSWTNNYTSLSDLCGATGSSEVTFTASDECGNTASTSATFTIADTTAPILICPANIIVNTDPDLCGANVYVPQPTFSEIGSTVTSTNSVNQTADASGFYPVGITSVDWTITDECGNSVSCSFSVTVHDIEAPVITCPTHVLICSTDSVFIGFATVTDNCEIASIANNAPSTFETGTTFVEWTATDIHGNSSNCTQTIVIEPMATAYAGEDDITCTGQPYTINTASVQNYSSVLWTTTGQGTIENDSTLNPLYIPANGETGIISLILTAVGISPCSNSVDVKSLTINPLPTISAGADFENCDNTPIILSSAVSLNASDVLWTSTGTGTFNNSTLVEATYTPSKEDVENGSVTLTLTATGITPCGTNSDEISIILTPAAKVFAGKNNTVCRNASYIISDATVTEATLVSWTHDGLGILENAGTINPTYIPAAAESGLVHLFVTATGEMICGSRNDSLTLQIIPEATVNAGNDITSCLSVPGQLNVAQATNYTSLEWSTSGTGTFSSIASLNPKYTPSQADLERGFVEVTLIAKGISPCGNATDVVRIDFVKAPTAYAGPDVSKCTLEPYTVEYATADFYTNVNWTHNGKGDLTNRYTLNPTYTPAPGETGSVELTLTAYGTSACSIMVISDLFVLTFYDPIVVNSGIDESIAAGTATTLNATVSGGTGVFSYNWSPENLLATNNTLNISTLAINNETVFTLTVTDVVSNCADSNEVTIHMGGIIRPIANDDYDTIGLNTSTLISVIANDSDPIGLGLNASIISNPKNGIATLNEDGSINYTPFVDFAGQDTLTYMICDNGTPSKCSTAKVIITIFPVRGDLEIYNLVIPNGDGKNDTWFIRGIDNYPDNFVAIFNRWGDKVNEFKGYDNSSKYWDGTNSKGEKLPSGTYYYILTLNSVESRTGWILLRWNSE